MIHAREEKGIGVTLEILITVPHLPFFIYAKI